jgi:outer membrane receptor for ferrienterochelin and colicins
MNTRTFLTSVSALAASAVLGGQAYSQSMDYAAMSDLFGEAVTAGATGAPQRASDVPATMIIITQDEIGRYPEYDIPGILRHFSGMDVTRYAFGDGQVSIRGAATGYTPRLLVLVNGREVYLDSYGYTAWSTLPVQLEEIQQIEVVKGPQSALYGFNAVAGVVNIITRNPQHGDYANARANIGTDGYQEYALTAARAFNEHVAVRFSYGATEADEFAPFATHTFANDLAAAGEPFDRETAALEARFRLNDDIQFSFEATMSDVRQAEADSIYYAEVTGYELNSFKADVEADTDWGYFTLTGYRNESDIDYAFGPMSNTLTSVRLQDLFKIGTDDTVRLSVEFREGNALSFPDPSNGDFGYETIAYSVMWNHKFSNAIDMTLAGRFDSVEWSREANPNPFLYPFAQSAYDQSVEEFSYNAAVVWRPNFGGSMRFMASRGVQAPTLFDTGFTLPVTLAPGFTVAISGNPAINPSIVTNYEIAYDRALSPTIDLRAAVFHQATVDVKGTFGAAPDVLPPSSPLVTFLFDNRGDTEVVGAEVSLAGRPNDAWSWDVNYTFKQVEDDLQPFAVNTPLEFEGATPSHLINAHLGWQSGRTSVDGYVNYVSGVDMPMQPSFGSITSVALDSHLGMSVRANYELTDHVGVSLNGQNINFGDGEVTNTHHQTESRFWLQLTAGF